MKTTRRWAHLAEFVRWFSDGERRYAQPLWRLASVWLKRHETSSAYGHLSPALGELSLAIER